MHSIALDAKGRLALPTRVREQLAARSDRQLILTVHPWETDATCLLLYPLPEWEEVERKVNRLPNHHPASRRTQIMLIGHAAEVELDGAGRVQLPVELREYAQFDKRVTFFGAGNKFEIWDEAVFREQRALWPRQARDDNGNLNPDLASLSI